MADAVSDSGFRTVWFKYTCCCSWLLIVMCFSVFVTALSAAGGLGTAADDICTQPELNITHSNITVSAAMQRGPTMCRALLECFATCNNQYDIITSVRIRQCVLGDADTTNGVSSVVDSMCTYDAATLAYNLAQRYRNSSVDVEYARLLFRQEVQLGGSGRRLHQEEDAVPDAGAAAFHLARATAATALAAATGTPLGDAAAAFTTSAASAIPWRRALNSHEGASPLSPAQALTESYANSAVAVSLALVVTGRFRLIFGWVAAVAALAMLPPILGLRGLGNTPPRCCALPRHVERMHKVSMRCACHCSYLWGVTILFLGALAATKYQVLSRYFTDSSCVGSQTSGTHCASSADIPALFGHASITMLLVPCVLAIVAGVLPLFYAMLLSRSRAERRDAIANDVPLKLYKQRNASKELSAPQPVLQGPPPNLAMLNPVIDSEFAASYAGPSTAPPAIGKLERV